MREIFGAPISQNSIFNYKELAEHVKIFSRAVCHLNLSELMYYLSKFFALFWTWPSIGYTCSICLRHFSHRYGFDCMFDMLPELDKDRPLERCLTNLGAAAFLATRGVQEVRDFHSRVYCKDLVMALYSIPMYLNIVYHRWWRFNASRSAPFKLFSPSCGYVNSVFSLLLRPS